MRLVSLLIMAAVSAPAAAQTEPAPAEPAAAVVCKRFQETGSLVKKRRVCLTKEQWAKFDKNARDRVEQMQTPGCSSQLDACAEKIEHYPGDFTPLN